MVTTLQRIGTITMFTGSILHIIFLLEFRFVKQTFWFQLIPFSIIVGGLVLSFGSKLFEDRLYKAFGMNVYIVGIGFDLKSAFIYDETPIGYFSCVLGGLLMIGGLSLIYLKKGKPTGHTINFQFIVGGLICAIGYIVSVLDVLLQSFSANIRIEQKTVDKAWIYLFMGTIYSLNGVVLKFINMLKRENGQAEPDVVFCSRNGIFDQILY